MLLIAVAVCFMCATWAPYLPNHGGVIDAVPNVQALGGPTWLEPMVASSWNHFGVILGHLGIMLGPFIFQTRKYDNVCKRLARENALPVLNFPSRVLPRPLHYASCAELFVQVPVLPRQTFQRQIFLTPTSSHYVRTKFVRLFKGILPDAKSEFEIPIRTVERCLS